MDRSLTAALLRPRHVVASVLVFLAFGGLSGLVVGLAQASEASSPGAVVVNSFTLAEPRIGDRGVYEVRSENGRAINNEYGDTWTRRIAFEWLGDETVRNTAGFAEWGNIIQLNVTKVVGQGELETDEDVYAVRPGTHDAFAYLRVGGRVDEAEDGDRGYTVWTQTGFQERDGELPCGFRNPLQGLTTTVEGQRIAGIGSCDQDRILPEVSRYLVPRQAVRQDGFAYLQAEARDVGTGMWGSRGAALELLFREDIPYPLQVQEGGTDAVFVLTSFERGTGPVPRKQAEVVADPPAPLRFAPLKAWGPDDSGVDHPFPASDAYRRALEEPSFTALRDFVQSHPGAYAGRVSFANFETNGREGDSQHWTFTMTDGDEALDVFVRRNSDVPAEWPLPVGVLPTTTAYEFTVGELYTSREEDFPSISSMEGRLAPTVASMIPSWEAYASEDYRGRTANSWTILIQCAYDWDTSENDCSRSTVQISAGFHESSREYPSQTLPSPVSQPGQPVDGYRFSHLHWIDLPGRPDLTFDHPYYYSDQRTDWRSAGEAAPVDAREPAFPSGSSSLVPLSVAGLWAFPSAPETAAIGFGALLLSLLYWVKPALKTGLVGLFSRVEPEELLANPVRAMLVAAVEANPGIHHQELVRIARKGNGAAEHHLQKLVTGGLLTRHRSAGYTCYFRAGKVDRRVMASAHLLKSPVARAIIEAAQRSPGTSLAQVARDAGVSVPTVHYHVQRLQAAGLVRWQGGIHPGLQGAPPAASPAPA